MGTHKIRLAVAVAVLFLFSGLVTARYAQLALSGKAQGGADEAWEGERGSILDRNGRVLAMDIPKYDVSVWRPSTKKESFLKEITELAALVGMEEAALKARYLDGGQNYFYIGKRLSHEAVEPLRAGISSGKFKGVQIDKISGRLYPEGALAAHLLGFTGEGNAGRDGIENKYDDYLRPKPRKAEDGTGRVLDGDRKVPKGDTITLTIDANLQFMLESIMDAARKTNGAETAMAVAMDVKTGEILAYVSSPRYDLNAYASATLQERSDPLSLYSYEPGSVFKIFSMASILDLGLITPSTQFDCDGAYRRTLPNGEKIVIGDLGVYGRQNLAGILALSSNAGVGYASDRISEIDLYQRLKSFGFGMRTGLGLSGESPGSIRDPERWSARTKPTIAIGQEVQVTALQMVTAAAAVANGGLLMKPATVARIETADGEVAFEHSPQVVRRVVSESTAKSIVKAMEAAASMEGTGWRAKVSDIRMAVKTGTAQMIDSKTRAYSDKDYIASTLGIFPAEDPRIALYVALVKPRGASYLGGQIAAPVLREAIEATLSKLDIQRGKVEELVHGGEVVLTKAREVSIGEAMPDLSGYSKKELLPLLERSDLRVVIEGNGYVVSQEPKPGAAIKAGQSLRFILR